jgi:hypothetical protein
MLLATTLKDGQLAWDDDLPVATQGWLWYNGGKMVVSHGSSANERGADRRQAGRPARSSSTQPRHHILMKFRLVLRQ